MGLKILWNEIDGTDPSFKKFSAAEQSKLSGVADGATAGADWATNVANKPVLGTMAAQAADSVAITGGTISGTGITVSNPVNNTDVANKQWTVAQIAAMGSELAWYTAVLDRYDPTSGLPADPETGDRYLATATANGWTTNNIYEWSGTEWTETVPELGRFVNVLDETTVIYNYNGATWDSKQFEATTASTGLTKVGLDIRMDSSAAGAALSFDAGVLSVGVDDVTIEVNTDALRIKDGGVSEDKIGANAVALAKLKSDVVDPAGAVELGAQGLKARVDGTTVEIVGNQIKAVRGITTENVMRKITAGEVSAGYLDLVTAPANILGVHLHAVGGTEQRCQNRVGTTGVPCEFLVSTDVPGRVFIRNGTYGDEVVADLSQLIVEDDVFDIWYEV